MKSRTKRITITAVMIALCIVVQLLKVPTLPLNISFVGAAVNLILIITTLYCGLLSGTILAIIAPVTSFIITGSPLISAIPLIIPCIMIGNEVIVLFAWIVRGKKLELNLMPLSLVAGAFAKAGVMTLLIVNLVLPQFGTRLAAPMLNVAKVTYSSTQLLAALIGAVLACMIWPIIKLAVKR